VGAQLGLPFGVASVVEHALLVAVAHGGSAVAYASVPARLALGRAGGPRPKGQGRRRVGVAAGDLAQQQGCLSLGMWHGGGSPDTLPVAGPRHAGRRRWLWGEAQQQHDGGGDHWRGGHHGRV